MKVVIVGAGLIGLAVADELSRRGAQVILLERNAAVGSEASSAAAGILSPQGEAKGPGPLLDLFLAGYQLIPEAVARLEALTGIDLRFRAGGMLAVALTQEDEQELEGQCAWQRKAGLRLERLSAAQVRSMEPAIDGPVRWGIGWPQTAQIDNVRMVEAYHRIVRSQGVDIETGALVLRFLIESDRVVGVETSQGDIRADWTVDCAGSWAGFDPAFPVPIPTFPVKGQILRFRTEEALFQRVVRSPRAYFVQRAADELIVGTTVEQVGFNKEVTDEGRRMILQGGEEIASRLASLPLEAAWAGLRPGTPDGLPVLGPTPLKQFLLAAGHFRSGILLAPLTGRLVAEWILKGSCSIDLSTFSISRFLAQAAAQ